VAPSSSQA